MRRVVVCASQDSPRHRSRQIVKKIMRPHAIVYSDNNGENPKLYGGA